MPWKLLYPYKEMQSTLNTKNPVDSNVFPSVVVVVPKSQSGQVESGDLDRFANCCPDIIYRESSPAVPDRQQN